jgi:hypothetical protein
MVQLLKGNSVTLEVAGKREFLSIVQKFLVELNQESQGDREGYSGRPVEV